MLISRKGWKTLESWLLTRRWTPTRLRFVGPIANLKGRYFQPSLSVSLSVCLCVCLWLALLPFNVNRFWWNFVTRTLLWSSLAATIMVQIGYRGTVRRLFENFKKFSKITEFEFQNSGSSFFLLLCLLSCKKNRLDPNKTEGGDRFWSLLLCRFRQWHCCSSTTLGRIFWLNRRRGGVQRSKLGGILNWGRSELGAQSGRKNQPACSFLNI